MKEILISEGCLAFYTTVDGKMLDGESHNNPMTEEEKSELVDYLLVKVKDGVKDNTISINSIIELFQSTNYEYDDTCEQCGDNVTRTYYNI